MLASVAVAAAVLASSAAVPSESAAASKAGGRVVIAVLPYGVPIEAIGAIDGISPGVMSAGLGSVPPAQSFIDIGQGNRVNKGLYDSELPPMYARPGRIPEGLWERVRERADDAPADVVPGLLGSTLEAAGVPVATTVRYGLTPILAASRQGEIPLVPERDCRLGCAEGLTVVRFEKLAELRELVAALGPDDYLMVFAAGSRSEQQLWPIGIAGEGFDGNLTSDSTRTDGVVVASDVAPTVLGWFGVEVPDEMNGSPIRAEGRPDAAEVADLQDKLADRPSRDLVALLPLVVWLALSGLTALVWGSGAARAAFRLFGLACVWAPFLLLVAAALDASEPASALIMGLGAPALAALTNAALPGLLGLAAASAVTVGAYAVDVIAGSPYTSLSVLGPNPGGGVRFFGIGNELEAVLTTLTLVGTGAWLASRRAAPTPRGAALWFLAIAALATLAFAPGRFGADVGAAIVLGVGGAAAAVLALGIERRRAIALVLGGGVLALAGLFAVDLALGGAHLSRSVLGAGEASDVADVIERRVSLMVRTFTDPVYPELLVLAGVVLVAGFVRRERILAWLGDAWPARCGFVGALTGVLLGTLANDSGSVLLVIGTIYLGACASFFWANSRPA